MTTPTPRPTLSPLATDALRWLAGSRKAPVPDFAQGRDGYIDLLRELHTAGLTDAVGHLSEAGYAEAARLEEEASPQPARPAPAPPPPAPAEPAFTIGGAIVGFIAQILMVPEGRKVAAGLIDSALDQLKRNREESRRVAEEIAAEKPAPATTERRAPKKGRRRHG